MTAITIRTQEPRRSRVDNLTIKLAGLLARGASPRRISRMKEKIAHAVYARHA